MTVSIRTRAVPTPDRVGKARPRHRPASTLPFLWPVLAFSVLFFAYPLAKNVQVSLQDFTLASLYTGDAPYVTALLIFPLMIITMPITSDFFGTMSSMNLA